MEENTYIPINIWDDFWDDGHVPQGEKQETYIYVEEYDGEFSEETKKAALEKIIDFFNTLDLTGVSFYLYNNNSRDKYPYLDEMYQSVRWEIRMEHLTHARLEILLEELKKANLSVDGIPFDIYSES